MGNYLWILLVVLFIVAILFIWNWAGKYRCTTCGQFHFDAEYFLSCKECGRPFCKQCLANMTVSFTFGGSSGSRIGTSYCGAFVTIATPEGSDSYYLCAKHALELMPDPLF
jgi:hypothetical protein